MVLAGRISRRFSWCWLLLLFYPHWTFFLFRAIFPRQRHSTLAAQVHDGLHQLWVLPWLLLAVLRFARLSVTFYHKRYGFERALFNHRRFLPCAPSDAGRNTPSRIFLYACRHRIVPSSWHMVLNYSYCRYKTIGLAITSVSHEI